MAIDMNDIKNRTNDLIDMATDVAEGIGAKAKPLTDKAAEAAKPLADRAAQAAKPLMDRAADAADGIAEQMSPHVERAKDAASDLYEKSRPQIDLARETAGDLVDKARPHAQRAMDGIASALDKAFDFLEEKTKTDLDRDGVIGAAVKEALEIEVDATEGDPAVEDDIEPDIELAEGTVAADVVDDEVVDVEPQVADEADAADEPVVE